MGVILRGILGGFSGRVANVVGGSWKGIAYMRSLPLSVANPNTAGQIEQRQNFKRIVGIATAILATIVKPLWDRFAQAQSGYNAFVSANIGFMNYPGVIDYAQGIMSRGSLLPAVLGVVTAANASPTVTIPWTNNGGTGNALAGDEAFVLVINETNSEFGTSSGSVIRSTATLNVTMPVNNSTADVLHVYLAFRRADGTLVSNSNYQSITV